MRGGRKFDVEENNYLVTKNIPTLPVEWLIQISGVEYHDLNSCTLCLRRSEVNRYGYTNLFDHFKGKTRISDFLNFLPVKYFIRVVLVESNEVSKEGEISWRELLRFIFLFLLKSTITGSYD